MTIQKTMFTVESCSKVKHLIGALNMDTSLLGIALRELNRLVLNDVEFPNAISRLATGLSLTLEQVEQLEALYDNQGWSK